MQEKRKEKREVVEKEKEETKKGGAGEGPKRNDKHEPVSSVFDSFIVIG